MNERTIEVEWERVEVSRAVALHGAEDFGLYQIYGWHPVYGRGEPALLYVGQAIYQSFGRRLGQHRRQWLADEIERRSVPFHVRVGRLPKRTYESTGPRDWADWAACVADAERVTIWTTAPAYNSASIARAPMLDVAERVIVEQLGDRGDLPAECAWPGGGPADRALFD